MNARSRVSLLAILAGSLCLVFALCGLGTAADAAKLVGTVSVSTDDDDNITVVRLTVGETVYNVTLDANGKKLGAEMANKKVEVMAIAREQDDEKWITVQTFKEIKAPEPEDEN